MDSTNTDRIDKKIFLRATRAKVWRLLTDQREFGEWFGVVLDGPFSPGVRVTGRITHKGYEHVKWEITVDRMESERLLSWRWHPHAIDNSVDYSSETPTLIVFELEEVKDGTMLHFSESGFDAVPVARRAMAYQMNEQGWAMLLQSLIDKYDGQAA